MTTCCEHTPSPETTGLVDHIAELDRAGCLILWRRTFGHQAPKHMSQVLMRKLLAREVQVRRFGGLSPALKRALKSALKAPSRGVQMGFDGKNGGLETEMSGPIDGKGASPNGTKRRAVTTAPVLAQGTSLIREWNGCTYQVVVTRDGFEMDGRSYRSLSAIARKITGAHWSGPRFFGLGR
ncbi:putative bacteriophage-related protein [Roseibium sp. TrichSKD4]|uniref:DUF2924 domain-containing protein n=1 Tax=Roseibium sp. TrichSKD4 TaxID=744980 RepID=UPI0001E57571|nr:DUF2924 domain-containing protein [Roseibium sp. TrichSKD4]EFO29966.1 putative bacteriophage-related protein [Roseibium sp. TrichSKD4]